MNVCSEISTHRREQLRHPLVLDAWIGQRIANEYDLEGVSKCKSEPKPFYLN